MKRTIKIATIVYSVIAVLYLLDNLPGFDIKSQILKIFVYLGFLLGSPIMVVWYFVSVKPMLLRIVTTALPLLFVIWIGFTGLFEFGFSIGAWRTQTVLYENKNSGFKTIEFQMQDVGALGYNSRTAEVLYVTPLFIICSPVPTNIRGRDEWIWVNKEVNEIGLRGG